jgi:protein-tyrosine sulfotransferase
MGFLRRLGRALRLWTSSIAAEMRRTRRVILVPETVAATERPIFITGVGGSGTILVRRILAAHSRIACPPESFFITPLNEIFRDEKAIEGLAAMGFTKEHVLQRLRQTVSYFFETYATAQGKPRWADETTSYIDCLDLIDGLYRGTGQFVFVYRHGLEVACSLGSMQVPAVEPYLDSCDGDWFVASARYWVVQCEKMLTFQSQHSSQCLELRYEELTRDPEVQAQRILEFLEEPWEEQLLEFDQIGRDDRIGLEGGRGADAESLGPRIATWKEQAQERMDRMLQQATPMLETLGYSVGFLPAPESGEGVESPSFQ